MRKLLSSLAFTAVLLALGTAAFAAMPTSDAPAVADASPALNAGAAPAAPSAAINYTAISLPLESGVADADEVANYIGSGITQVAYWDTGLQGFVIYNTGDPFATPFGVSVGDFLLVGADNTAPTNMTWVGDVPAQGSVSFSKTSNGYVGISLPLDQTSITDAEELGNAIGDTTQVARWDTGVQGFVIYNVGDPFATPFAVEVGYPYLVYTTNTGTWPTP